MKIVNFIAQNIVEELKDIIKQDINYFDEKGCIIASTDMDRVGEFHGGAKRSIDLKDDIIIKYDDEYKGAKKGINVPIYFDNKVIGAVGITGEIKEVEKYGQIIRKMTQILIKENYLKEQSKNETESKRQFVEELLFSYQSDNRSLMARSELLNLKIDSSRKVIVLRALESDLNPKVNKDLSKYIDKTFGNNPQNLITKNALNIIIIYEINITENVLDLLEKIKLKIENKHKVKLYVGIGQDYKDIYDAKKSYGEAKKALDISLAFQDNNISLYKDLNIGLLIGELSPSIINKYINIVFKDISKKEINEYQELMDIYVKHNGSITKTADELYIHKNTLQYRLKKIKEITGFDPRNIKDMVILYLAFSLFRLDFDKQF